MIDRAWMIVFIGCVFVTSACAGTLGELRSVWNSANAGAVDLEIAIAAGHQADLDQIVQSETLNKAQKLSGVDAVEEKWAPAYHAYRTLRAVLASTRAALVSGEDGVDTATLIRNLLTAQHAAEEAMP